MNPSPAPPSSPETSAPPRPMRERDITELRQEARDLSLAGAGEPEAIASVEEISCSGVPARLYRPAGDERTALVWLHGGGWMLCDPACYDTMARALANRAGCAVLSVGYRRAPEHRYPAATDDAWRATRWASGQFGQVAVGGDSSGGNLAAAVALRAREAGLRLALQLLVYPVLDADPDATYREDFAKRHGDPADPTAPVVSWPDNMRYIWQQYVPDPARRREADAAPMRAASLASLAPALLITAERDILRAEAEEYARRLAADGVPVQLHHYPATNHGFFHLLATADARAAVAAAAAALREAFGEHSASRRRPRRTEPEARPGPNPRISLCRMPA
jgi:acetyl esterase